ncbi:MAG TPA: SdpI family protein [Chloroflexota bacterium]|nr:SdpI family protein [Chloroflexota bacterium]
MNRGPSIVASVAIVAAMIAMSMWAWMHLPPGARIAVHWASNGTPDRYAYKVQALLQLPIVACLVSVIFAAVPRALSGRLTRGALWGISEETYAGIWAGIWVTCLLAISGNHAVTVLMAAGAAPAMVVQTEIGILFIILGSYHLGNVQRTSLLGVRTPWTLASDLAWTRSQHMAGRALIAMGLSVVFLALYGNELLLMGGFVGWVGVFLAGVMAYSYRLWRLDPRRRVAEES